MLRLTLGDLSSRMVQGTGVFFQSVNFWTIIIVNQLNSEIRISWLASDLARYSDLESNSIN